MKTIISGSNHFIIPKKIVATTCMVGAAFFVGTYISEHMHYRQNEQFIRAKNLGVQESNSKLLREKIAYESIFDELKDHLADWEKGRDMSLVEQAEHVTNFHEQARRERARAAQGRHPRADAPTHAGATRDAPPNRRRNSS